MTNGTTFDLVPSFDNPLEGYTDSTHPLNDTCRSDMVHETFRYVNESIRPIGVVGTNGIKLTIRGRTRNRNRLIIVRTLVIGVDVEIDLNACKAVLGEHGEDYISYVSNVIERERGNRSRTIEQYYVVDTTNLWGEPNGVYLNQIGVTIYDTRHKQNINLSKDEPFVVHKEKDDQGLWGGCIQLLHVPKHTSDNRPVYMRFGTNIVEVDASHKTNYKPGFHVFVHGGARFAFDNIGKDNLHVEPDRYKEIGIHSSYNQLFTESTNKEHATEVINMLQKNENLRGNNLDAKPVIKLLDELTLGGYSLRECSKFVGELLGTINKIKTDVKNVAS